MRSVIIRDIGVVPYDEAFALQRRTVSDRQNGRCEDTLFLLEHPHVITMGRNANTSSLIASASQMRDRAVTLAECDRGGDVTYHGPGQLVGYPILSLEPDRHDIKRFVGDVEETLIRLLADFGIRGERHPAHRGVWLGERKIASVGIRISRWVTSHGFALNVSTDLSYFKLIHPCGIAGCEMTSISRELGRDVDMAEAKKHYVRHFTDVFGRGAILDGVVQEVENSD